jgi:hypothetical protein
VDIEVVAGSIVNSAEAVVNVGALVGGEAVEVCARPQAEAVNTTIIKIVAICPGFISAHDDHGKL